MKKLLVATCVLASSMAFADVDYSRCLMSSGMWGASIDNDGKIQFGQFMKLKSQKTEGKTETYEVESGGYGGTPFTTKFQIVRDDNGNIVKVSTGGDKLDAKAVKAYKDMVVNGSVYMGANAQYMGGGMVGGYVGGYGGQMASNPWQGNYQRPDFMYSEPTFYVDNKMIPLSKLSKEEAKKAGFNGNIEELQKAKQQWRKDKKVIGKIKDGYSKVMEKTPLVIPMGQETDFEVKDGVCLVKGVAYKSFNTKTKEVVKTPGMSRENCEEMMNIHKKYETKLNECADVNMKMNNEYFAKGIYNGGGYAGGGYAGGIVGGVSFGGYGMGSMSTFQCESLYGVGQVQAFGQTGGIVGGSAPSSEASQQ